MKTILGVSGAARGSDARLPLVRIWIAGPRWKQLAGAPSASGHYDFEPDVRELVCEQIRFDVYAEWSDARERWGGRV